jgi:hypothetical protein
VTGPVGEAGGPGTPGLIHRTVAQRHAALGQLGTDCVHVIDEHGQQEAPAPTGRHHRRRLDQRSGFGHVPHIADDVFAANAMCTTSS